MGSRGSFYRYRRQRASRKKIFRSVAASVADNRESGQTYRSSGSAIPRSASFRKNFVNTIRSSFGAQPGDLTLQFAVVRDHAVHWILRKDCRVVALEVRSIALFRANDWYKAPSRLSRAQKSGNEAPARAV